MLRVMGVRHSLIWLVPRRRLRDVRRCRVSLSRCVPGYWDFGRCYCTMLRVAIDGVGMVDIVMCMGNVVPRVGIPRGVITSDVLHHPINGCTSMHNGDGGICIHMYTHTNTYTHTHTHTHTHTCTHATHTCTYTPSHTFYQPCLNLHCQPKRKSFACNKWPCKQHAQCIAIHSCTAM